MTLIAMLAAAAALAGSPDVEEKARVDDPPECHLPNDVEGKWAACAEAATIGSIAHVIANMNLGSEAYVRGDYEMAARFYDFTVIEGQDIYSDPFLHAFRGAVFERVGRHEEAVADARKTLEFIALGQADWEGEIALTDPARAVLYESILEVLADNGAEEYPDALAAYRALPVNDLYDRMNRAAIYTELGLYDDALPFSEEVLAAMPDHPGLLNNHCYLLALMGRGEEAVPYCERAVAADPHVAAFQDSLAEALSAAGRCEEARAALDTAAELEPSAVIYKEPLPCESAGGAP
jgi:tetratricopeptide (TPR) repeat protein